MRGEVGRAAVADGHGRVLLQKQQRHGLADDVAAAYDHGFLAADRDTGPLEHVQRALGRAGHHAVQPARQASRVDITEAVHVLFRQNERKRPVAVQMARQGQLDQNAVNGRICIGFADGRFQRLLRGVGGHAQRARIPRRAQAFSLLLT